MSFGAFIPALVALSAVTGLATLLVALYLTVVFQALAPPRSDIDLGGAFHSGLAISRFGQWPTAGLVIAVQLSWIAGVAFALTKTALPVAWGALAFLGVLITVRPLSLPGGRLPLRAPLAQVDLQQARKVDGPGVIWAIVSAFSLGLATGLGIGTWQVRRQRREDREFREHLKAGYEEWLS